MSDLPRFSEDALYKRADRWEFTAHDQDFVFYEFSLGFVGHRLLGDQYEAWFGTKGRYLADLEDTAANRRRLRDMARHLWCRGRPAHDASRPHRRIGRPSLEPLLSYRDLLTEDMEPLFEGSTFWLAERLRFDRDLGHIWKILIAPLHIARTREQLERLIIDDVPSPWRLVTLSPPHTPATWTPDWPSRRGLGASGVKEK